MSAAALPDQSAALAAAGKKAVHVKWAGKTIALGTFPTSEADEKCARAKALTREWRSIMRPKPTREWVMQELERLGVRVVSGRLGRKSGEDGDDENPSLSGDKKSGGGDPSVQASQAQDGSGGVDRRGSLGWGSGDAELNSLVARRNSLGLSMANETNRRGSLGLGLDSGAAYDAAQQDRLNSMGMTVSAHQHYEMLKLHHMNLLNEIQETTLLMNLYQQQQLQQQQQQLQQAVRGGRGALDLMLGSGSALDEMMGFGTGGLKSYSQQQQQQQKALMLQQNLMSSSQNLLSDLSARGGSLYQSNSLAGAKRSESSDRGGAKVKRRKVDGNAAFEGGTRAV